MAPNSDSLKHEEGTLSVKGRVPPPLFILPNIPTIMTPMPGWTESEVTVPISASFWRTDEGLFHVPNLWIIMDHRSLHRPHTICSVSGPSTLKFYIVFIHLHISASGCEESTPWPLDPVFIPDTASRVYECTVRVTSIKQPPNWGQIHRNFCWANQHILWLLWLVHWLN